ncbi:MAG: response regulator [Planctomycetota bacterium]|jgi:CheY-like chemotaxis protein
MKPVRKRVLIVDPCRASQHLLKKKLSAGDLRVRTCGGGAEAIGLMEREPIDLVLCSLEMPAPDGAETLRRMKEKGLRPPVIFLSRLLDDDPAFRAHARRIGTSPVFGRPVLLNRLYEAIEAALATRVRAPERRRRARPPVRVRVRVELDEPVEATTLDLTADGLTFERPMCDVCTGYRENAVDPDCALHRLPPVRVELHLPPGQKVRLEAHVAHVRIEEGATSETIDLRFTDAMPADRRRLRTFLACRPAF